MAIKELFNNARPQVLFDPRASQRIDPRFKFTRDGIATYHDEDGRLQTVQKNQPRIDGSGLYIEPARTNRARYSAAFDQDYYKYLDVNIAYGTAGLAPDGVSPYRTFTTTSATNQLREGENYTYSIAPNDYWTASVYVNAAASTAGRMTFALGSTGLNHNYGYLDIAANKTISVSFQNQGLGGAWDRTYAVDAGYIDLGNNVYRVWYTTQNIVGFTGNWNLFGLYPSANKPLGWTIHLWGLQVEKGYGVTSYIPTPGTSAVTRPADLLTIEAPLPATGSIYIDARSLGSGVDTTLLSAAPASPSTDKLALAIRQPASLYNSKALVYEVDGAFKPTLPFPVPTNARERNLITYGANNYHYRSDSARYTPSSSSSVPANMTRLGIGHDVTDPTKAMTGYINAVYLWPGEITPTVAEALVRGDVDPKDADAGVFTPAAGSLAFVFNTQGTATDGNAVVQLPLRGSTNNVLVDWGDNTSSSLIGAAASVTVNHTYSSAGIYPVQIEADNDGTNSGLENLQFYANSPADLVRVLQWGAGTTFNPTTMYRAFRDCTQLDFESGARTNLPDTSAITDWREAFTNCSSLSGSFPSFNFSAATNFANAWQGCSSLTAFPAAGDQTQKVISFSAAWSGCSSLAGFPLLNTSASTNFEYAWMNCSSLTSFPLVNTGAATTIRQAWSGCSGLTSFPSINTSLVTSFYGTWEFCSALTSFPLLNTSKGTNFGLAWRGCSSLTSFPVLDTSLATSFYISWDGCGNLTSFPLLNSANVTDFSYAWRNCSGLTSFPLLDTSSGTNFSYAWTGCISLTSFPLIDTSKGTNFFIAWRNCSGLTSFPLLDTSSGTNFSYAWTGCISLTSFPSINTSLGTAFQSTWQDCSSLTTFPANFFDSWTGTPANLCFYQTWLNCTSLTPASVVSILDSIAASGQSAPSGTGTNDRRIDIHWDGTGDPATDAAAAITTLKSRNWQIYLNNVLQ